ncbi:MAG TPA: hypothetical protein DDY98_02655 [Ruminococcaceae bacterium]|nr:hypothetical protein [Oscillospiraceae bacterium]
MKRLAKLAHRLIYDNKLLMIVSLAVAVLVWLFVAILLSPTDTTVLKNVPVELELANSVPAQFGLEVFGQRDFTVDVEITGKRYVIGGLTSDSKAVKVIAQTQYVDSAGKSRLELKATKVHEEDEFEIVSLSSDAIEVFFDTYVEKDFPLEVSLDAADGVAEDGYMTSDPVLSEQVVNVSGPATEVNSIVSVEARVELDKPLTETQTFDAEIVAQNESGGTAHYLTFNKDNSVVSVTVPIYLVTEKPTSVEFINTPLYYHTSPLQYRVSPATVKAGVQGIEKEDDLETISVATVDFATLKPGTNTIRVSPKNINGVKIITETESIEITVTVPNCTTASRKIADSNITFTNVPKGYEVGSIVKGIEEVTLVGPAASVQSVKAQDITATLDLSDADPDAAEQTFAAVMSIKNNNDCWVYGAYSVTLAKK